MLTEQLLYDRRIEETLTTYSLRGQHGHQKMMQIFPKPPRDGKAESSLRAVEDLSRQIGGECSFEKVFLLQTTDLKSGRQSRHELDERLIEERYADLQRHGHARPIRNRQ